MVDDTSDSAQTGSELGRVKRAPPTIDLEPTSSQTHAAADDGVATATAESWAGGGGGVKAESLDGIGVTGEAEPAPPAAEKAAPVPPGALPPPASAGVSPWVIAPFSGAVAAALVIGIGWMLGWPAVQPPSAEPQLATAIDGLNARIAGLEAKSGKPDATITTRLDTLDKASASLRGDLAGLKTQSDKTASALNDLKATPRDGGPTVDLAPLTARIDQIERANRAQDAAIAQGDQKIAAAKPADDKPMRRIIAAALLDVAVRHGDGYAAALSTAKALAPNPDALTPLDAFAATGIPSPATLDRDLLAIVPKLSPLPAETATTGNSIVDRLQAGAAKLVRIERTDVVGTDRGAIVSRVTAAALRNDFEAARRELESLAPSDRVAAQAWLDKVAARDAALNASRQFADAAMTALATSR